MATIPLDHASPHGSRDLPGCAPTDGPYPLPGHRIPIRSCSRRGLPCRLPYGWRGGLLPHRFTLTFEPKLSGGLFSVALSLRLPSAGVARRRIRVEPGLSSTAPFRALLRGLSEQARTSSSRGRPADWCALITRSGQRRQQGAGFIIQNAVDLAWPETALERHQSQKRARHSRTPRAAVARARHIPHRGGVFG